MKAARAARDLVFRVFMTIRTLWTPASLGVAGMVFASDGRVLLVRHRYNAGWRLPGGGADRGEPPKLAVMRELAEEVGLSGGTCEFHGLFVRKAGWVTQVVVLYRIRGASVNFRPNLEIREICFADPLAPPKGCAPSTRRRLEEIKHGCEPSLYW
jgi:8-oxo-dGTP pyrophosphatase MutT (NUDIX family)